MNSKCFQGTPDLLGRDIELCASKDPEVGVVSFMREPAQMLVRCEQPAGATGTGTDCEARRSNICFVCNSQ